MSSEQLCCHVLPAQAACQQPSSDAVTLAVGSLWHSLTQGAERFSMLKAACLVEYLLYYFLSVIITLL